MEDKTAFNDSRNSKNVKTRRASGRGEEASQQPVSRQPAVQAATTMAQARLMSVVGQTMERASWAGCRRAGAWFGLAFFHAARHRRVIAIGNLQAAFPQLSEAGAARIARRAAQNFGMTFCEFLHLRTASAQEIRDYCSIEGMEHIEAGFARGRGIVLMTAHLGNWEVMGARVAQEFKLTAMSRPTSNVDVQSHLAGIRRAVGMNIISKFDTARPALRVLRDNGALAIFGDHHASKEEPLLPMFGRPTRVVSALARLALMSGAPIVGGFGTRRTPWLADGRIVTRVFPGFDVTSPSRDADARAAAVLQGTRQGVELSERIISRFPDQWLWMHRRWREADNQPNAE